jgi:hypothetical protein
MRCVLGFVAHLTKSPSALCGAQLNLAYGPGIEPPGTTAARPYEIRQRRVKVTRQPTGGAGVD